MKSTGRYSLGQTILAGVVLLSFLSTHETTATESVKGRARFATLDNIHVHYTDYNEGDFALLFVHGWNCDESVWNGQAAFLARQFHVITVDLPGHGQSDKPEIAYTMDLHARAIEAVLREAGVKSAVLVGHSNGTPVIRQFYRRFSEYVRALVIVDGALRPFGDRAMMEKFIAPLRGRDYEQTASRFISGMTAPIKDAKQREQIKTMMMRTPQQVAVSEMEGLMDPALWEQDQIDVPVLMILAKQPAWTPEYEEFARSLVPALDYQIWEGVSHFVMIDKAAEFDSALLRFLKQHKLPK